MQKQARLLILLGGIVLLGTALLHASGFYEITNQMEASGTKSSLVNVVRGLWLMFSFHLVVLSIVFFAASRIRGGKPIILISALIPAIDTFILLSFVGVFLGTGLLAFATILLLIGGVLFPKISRESVPAAS